MPDSNELLESYDRAMAVMSAPCYFVEWKAYIGGEDPKTWFPVGLDKNPVHAVQKITGERWIYVFRHYARFSSSDWVDELHLAADGQLSATPMDKAHVEPDKRPKPIAIGKTVSFARRITGVAMEYYFLASRIRLPLSTIKTIGSDIEAYVAPINFEPDDKNIIAKTADGALIVPVLDPITVALHLHAYFVAAANDLLDYTTTHNQQSAAKQAQVTRRLQKVFLGRLIHALADPNVDKDCRLVARLRHYGNDLTVFLEEYGAQVQHRIYWRDTWCSFLSRWLRGTTMKALALAHLKNAPRDFATYLSPFLLCLTRTNESPEGQQLLDKLYEDSGHWIHTYILPKEKPTGATAGIITKFVGEILSVILEWGPRWFAKPALYSTLQFEETIGYVVGVKVFKVEGEEVFRLPTREAEIKVTKFEFETKVMWKPKWGVKSATGFLAAINFIFAAKGVVNALHSGSPADKAFAVASLAGSALDGTSAALQFVNVGKKTLAGLGMVAALINMLVSARSFTQALDKGDTGGIVGSVVVLAGDAFMLSSGIIMLLSLEGGPVLAIVGIAITIIGKLISWIWGDSDSPYEELVAHCEWGDAAGTGEELPDWADKRFSEWRGNYDVQLRAAVAVICGLDLDGGEEDLRESLITVRWALPNSVLHVDYKESWNDSHDDRVYSSNFTFGNDDNALPVSNSHQMVIKKGDDPHIYVIRPQSHPGEKPIDIGRFPHMVTPELKSLDVSVRLTIDVSGVKFQIPKDNPLTRRITGQRWNQ